MNKISKKGIVGSLGLAAVVFIISAVLVQFLVYQEYLITRKSEREQLQTELNRVKDGFRGILYSDITVANALAIIHKNYRDSYNFDSAAMQLMAANKYVEAMQITSEGVITHVYPHERYDSTVGLNMLSDSLRKKEADKAIHRNDIFFAGPRKLRLGGTGILGKVPMFANDKLIGFSVVLTKLPTIIAALKLNDTSKQIYSYKLTKNGSTDSAGYYFTKALPGAGNTSLSTQIPEGDWTLSVAYSTNRHLHHFPVLQSLLGVLLALFAGIFTYHRARRPYKLEEIIALKTKELSVREKYYRTLIEASADAIVHLDAGGKILYQSPSVEKITGYSFAEMQGIAGISLIHPDDRARDSEAFNKLISRSGEILQITHRLKRKDGSYVWLESTHRNLLQDENVHGIILNYHDITDRVAAQNQLKERVKELTTIFYTNEILKDDKQSTDDVLSRIVALLPPGWQYPELCAARITFDGNEFCTANYAPSEFSQMEQFNLLDGRHVLIEVVYTAEAPFEFEGPFLKEERDLIKSVGETIKVYFNKAIQQKELRKSEANMKSIFDTTEVSYMLLDTDLNIVAFNEYFQKGYAGQTDIKIEVGRNFLDMVMPDKKALINGVLQKVIRTHTPIEYETEYSNKAGTNYFSVLVSPVLSDDNILGLCIAGNNITKRKKLEIERENLIDDLLLKNRDLHQFSHIVSHNIRGPLATILGLNNLLREAMPVEEMQGLLEGIRITSEKMDTVIRDLNTILHIKKELSETKIVVDLNLLLSDVIGSISIFIKEKNAVIDADFSAGNTLETVKPYMNSIFYNLVTNSLKYSRADVQPYIKIWTEVHKAKFIINFEDNGTGIDLVRNKDKIFMLYQRFHHAIDGRGLGLFLTKTQVEALSGKIEIESTPDVGTKFRITFQLTAN